MAFSTTASPPPTPSSLREEKTLTLAANNSTFQLAFLLNTAIDNTNDNLSSVLTGISSGVVSFTSFDEYVHASAVGWKVRTVLFRV